MTSGSTRRLAAVLAVAAVLAASCSDATAERGTEGSDPTVLASSTTNAAAPADPSLRLNEIQVVGSHNSYHVAPDPALYDIIAPLVTDGGDNAAEWLYTHAPLDQQLDRGVRSFELDVFADPDGGLFLEPQAPVLFDLPHTPDPALAEPGWKVLHVQDIDFETTCPTLIGCLETIETWSDANPDHEPIPILIEVKNQPLPEGFDLTPVVEVIDAAVLDTLDAEIRSVFDPDDLIEPDEVRGDAASLVEAIESGGWPTVEESLGQVYFVMDNGGDIDVAYRDGTPQLEGRVLFTSAGADRSDGAVVKLNEPEDGAAICAAVAEGRIVRTRADAGLVIDEERRDLALATGAQIVSTDFPPGEPDATSGYVVELSGGASSRPVGDALASAEVC